MKKIYLLSIWLVLGMGLFAQTVSKVTKTISPLVNTFPVVMQDNVSGGYHQVADVAGRDALPSGLKQTGMLVWVQDTHTAYQWDGAAWRQVQLVRNWEEGASFYIGDVFLYSNKLFLAKTAGTIAVGANPITDVTNWNIIGDNLDMTTDANATATYTVPSATVDGFSGVVITQTVTAGALTVTAPANTTAGRRFAIVNSGTSTNSLTFGSSTIPAGSSVVLVWDGTAWSAPSGGSSLSGLTAASATNTIDNTNYAQTWNWSTADTQNPLAINANALTTGTLLGLNANTLTTGTALNISSTSTDLTTGSLLNLATSGANAAASTTTTGAAISNTRTGTTGTNVGLSVTASGGTNNYALVVPSGWVGIGNAAPTVALDVTGDAKISGILSTPSDIRLKTNINTLTGVLDKLANMRGVSYEFIDQQKYAKGPQVGVIAQELQKVFPELVKQGSDGFLSVNYTQLSAVLLQAVKEQQARIEKLEKQMSVILKHLGME